MAKNLLKHCAHCSRYTLYEKCPECHEKTVQAGPPRFSIQDHYGKYRRMLKERAKKNNTHH